MGIISKEKEIKQVFINSPALDNVNFIEYFGLKKDKVYNYSVTETSYSDETQTKYIKDEFKVRIKVVDEYKINKGALYILDNDILNPTRTKSTQGILIVSNLVYFIDTVDVKAINRSKKNSDFMPDFGDETKPNFILPFFDGQKIENNGINQFFRSDNLYQCYVQKEGSSNYFDGEKMIELPRYRLFYLTLPDTEYIEFIPYIGIHEINYHHNGTKIELNIRMIDNEED